MLTVLDGGSQSWGEMSLEDMSFGNAMDADFTLRVYKLMRPQLGKTNVNLVYDNVLKDTLVTMAEIENFGIAINEDYLEELDGKLTTRLQEKEEGLLELSPVSGINLNSYADLATVLFTPAGFDLTPVKFSAKTKAPSLTEEHLKMVYESLDRSSDAYKFVSGLLSYKYMGKQHRTYVKGVRSAVKYNGSPRVYSQYNFATVVTGRLSCSTYTVKRKVPGKREGTLVNKEFKKGVSFHTLPRSSEDDDVNIRKLMIPDPDKAFLTADFATAELRVLAQCCKDPNLIEAFTGGRDLHKFTASLIFNKSIDEITKRERQIAKSVSFLIVYGGGPYKLASQINKSVGYCKNIFKEYGTSFPRVFGWIKEVRNRIKQEGHAVSLFGRRRHLENVNSPSRAHKERALRQGMNFIIQSSASDLMLHAIQRVKKYVEVTGLNVDILASVHDSIEVQCPYDEVEKTIQLLKYCLPRTDDLTQMYGIDFVVPFEVDIEAGKSFGDGIEAEFDSFGNLLNGKALRQYVQK